MKNIIKDIETNCPECKCDVEKTVDFLANRGDFSYSSEYHREIWFFYLEALNERTKKEARDLTIEMFDISFATFKNIRAKFNKTAITL